MLDLNSWCSQVRPCDIRSLTGCHRISGLVKRASASSPSRPEAAAVSARTVCPDENYSDLVIVDSSNNVNQAHNYKYAYTHTMRTVINQCNPTLLSSRAQRRAANNNNYNYNNINILMANLNLSSKVLFRNFVTWLVWKTISTQITQSISKYCVPAARAAPLDPVHCLIHQPIVFCFVMITKSCIILIMRPPLPIQTPPT